MSAVLSGSCRWCVRGPRPDGLCVGCGRRLAASGPPIRRPARPTRRPRASAVAVPSPSVTALRPPVPVLTAGPQAGDRVLSIRQPWASLILAGIKPVEVRSWDTPFKGRFWVHASHGLDARDWSEFISFPARLFSGLPQPRDLPRGAVLGSVELVDCLDCHDAELRRLLGETAWDRWARDGYNWLLRDPQVLAEPIPCGGRLNLWTWRG